MHRKLKTFLLSKFPFPIRLIDEKCPDEHYRDKHLGLWKTIDIPAH